jgi:hypothetical protein
VKGAHGRITTALWTIAFALAIIVATVALLR